MKDSILKGAGNSRFLKSAVPAGTSWADALAMLQAGTFPIDFNGINTDGFQQVGTPLNKANLLKDATAAQIGLPPSTTPDGMFQALGNTGELHVWRKTTVTPAGTTTTYPVSTNPNAYQEGDDAKEAGYVLGDVVTGENILSPKSTGSSWSWNYSDSVSVDENGVISLVNQNSLTLGSGISASSADVLIGKYVKQPNAGLFGDGYLLSGGVFYIPNNAVVTQKYGGGNSYTYFTIDRYQPVTGYAAIPAGTTIEYLGKLGDKARVQMVSYVGTGTYGKSNPNSLTFDFAPKIVIIINQIANNATMIMQGQTNYSSAIVGNNYRGSCNLNGKTLTYYNTKGTSYQMNDSGIKYLVLAIG